MPHSSLCDTVSSRTLSSQAHANEGKSRFQWHQLSASLIPSHSYSILSSPYSSHLTNLPPFHLDLPGLNFIVHCWQSCQSPNVSSAFISRISKPFWLNQATMTLIRFYHTTMVCLFVCFNLNSARWLAENDLVSLGSIGAVNWWVPLVSVYSHQWKVDSSHSSLPHALAPAQYKRAMTCIVKMALPCMPLGEPYSSYWTEASYLKIEP